MCHVRRRRMSGWSDRLRLPAMHADAAWLGTDHSKGSNRMASQSSDSTPWVDGLTIPEVLRDARSSATAITTRWSFPSGSCTLSYAEFGARSPTCARGLLAAGIDKGDHVAIWATNVPEWVILQFATAQIGAVLVTINPAYRPFELQYVLQAERRRGAVSGRSVQDVRLLRDAGRNLPGTGQLRSRAS